MKKLSISLFTVLAVIFAVSSAFTSPKVAMHSDNDPAFFLLLNPSDPTDKDLYDNTQSFANVGAVESFTSESCLDAAVSEEVCAAKWENSGSSPDFDLSVLSDGGHYMFRNE